MITSLTALNTIGITFSYKAKVAKQMRPDPSLALLNGTKNQSAVAPGNLNPRIVTLEAKTSSLNREHRRMSLTSDATKVRVSMNGRKVRACATLDQARATAFSSFPRRVVDDKRRVKPNRIAE